MASQIVTIIIFVYGENPISSVNMNTVENKQFSIHQQSSPMAWSLQ